MSYVLALDQGTTSSRAVLVDRSGRICASAQRELTQIYPQSGWVEHDPEEIWASQSGVAAEAVATVHAAPDEIVALGITNQRETTIVWDRRTGVPIYNAIVWQDRRTAGICDRMIADGLEPLVRSRTGLVIDPYFSGTKLHWLLENVDGLRARARRGELAFGTVDSWLIWKLTGGRRHVTDASNASRTLLFNIHTGTWDADLLAALAIPESLLPEIVGSSEVVDAVSSLHPFAVGAPIAGIAGDQQAALFGQECFHPGMAKNTYGTGCFVLMNTGDAAQESTNRLLTTVAWQKRAGGALQYALEGSVFIGGAVVQWLRDGLGLIRSAADIEPLAASVPDNGGVYLVPAFTGLGAPHWDPYARGTLVGITRGTTSGHLARAALEAIAYQSYDVLRAMEQDAGIPLTELRVDGGASRNDLLMQFQADLLQRPVIRPAVVETTVLGAAHLAGLAVGFLGEAPEEFASATHSPSPAASGEGVRGVRDLVAASPRAASTRFEPRCSADEMAALHADWERAVQRSIGWEKSAA